MEYTLNMTGISKKCRYINGIYMVYTWYNTCICRPDRYVWNTLSIPHGFVSYLFDMPLMYYVYPKDIHSISKVYHYKKRYGTNP